MQVQRCQIWRRIAALRRAAILCYCPLSKVRIQSASCSDACFLFNNGAAKNIVMSSVSHKEMKPRHFRLFFEKTKFIPWRATITSINMLTVITLSSLLVLSFGDNAAFHSNVAQRSAFGVPILLVRAPCFLTLFCYCLENATITASSLTMLSLCFESGCRHPRKSCRKWSI
jgi:hypothetical protein